MTLGARGPELTSLNVAKNFRTDLPPDAGSLRESAPYSYLLPALVLLSVAVGAVLAYLFFGWGRG